MKSDNNLREPADRGCGCAMGRETHLVRDRMRWLGAETENIDNTSATINATCGHDEMYSLCAIKRS